MKNIAGYGKIRIMSRELENMSPYQGPSDLDVLEHQLDMRYYGARRTSVDRPVYVPNRKTKDNTVDKPDNTDEAPRPVVSPTVAAQERQIWEQRDFGDRVTSAFGRIQAEQFLGRGLTPEEPLWPVGLFFDWDAHFGNVPVDSVGKKMHKAGISPSKTLGPFDNLVMKQRINARRG